MMNREELRLIAVSFMLAFALVFAVANDVGFFDPPPPPYQSSHIRVPYESYIEGSAIMVEIFDLNSSESYIVYFMDLDYRISGVTEYDFPVQLSKSGQQTFYLYKEDQLIDQLTITVNEVETIIKHSAIASERIECNSLSVISNTPIYLSFEELVDGQMYNVWMDTAFMFAFSVVATNSYSDSLMITDFDGDGFATIKLTYANSTEALDTLSIGVTSISDFGLADVPNVFSQIFGGMTGILILMVAVNIFTYLIPGISGFFEDILGLSPTSSPSINTHKEEFLAKEQEFDEAGLLIQPTQILSETEYLAHIEQIQFTLDDLEEQMIASFDSWTNGGKKQ